MAARCLESALRLQAMGCSVIPLVPQSKRPLAKALPGGKWEEFQHRIPTPEEIRGWFEIEPNANIALVCGEVSGVVAIDVDGPKGQAWFKSHMPRPNWYQMTSAKDKFHAFYQHPGGGRRIPPSVSLVNDEIDVRGDGSYVVFAPSIHPSGAEYRAHQLDGFSGIDSLVPLPDIQLVRVGEDKYEVKEVQDGSATDHDADVQKGGRNQAITSLCGRMYARGLLGEEVLLYAQAWNRAHCKPPLPDTEVNTIVRSMASTHRNRNPQKLNAGGVSRWVAMSSGEFCIADIYRDLGILKAEDRELCQQELRELLSRGEIEPCGKRSGWYRKRESGLEVIDLVQEETPPLDLWLPFGLHRMCFVQPRNIIVIAGETNSGKTGLLFNFCYMNRHKHKIRYLSSEMTPNEIRGRIERFGLAVEEWSKFTTFIQRSNHFHDAIDPNGINIVDFLEVYEDFSKIGGDIKKIFDRLQNGIAIITIQKKKGEMFGRGGEFTLEKARLGISLFTHGHLPNGIVGSMKVTKCKNYRSGFNPEGREQFFRLLDGYFYDSSPIQEIPDYNPHLVFWAEKDRKRLIDSIGDYCKQIAEIQKTQEIIDFYGE